MNSKNSSEAAMLGFLTDGSDAELLVDFFVSQELDQTNNLGNSNKITLKWDCGDKETEEHCTYVGYESIETEKSNG